MSYSDAYDANDGVAIIGLAGRFPGARNVDEFWNNLVDGRETLSFFADDELEPAAPDEMEARRQPNYVRSRGILADVEMFDAEFFGITATEAAVMDPQQRVFMETAWEALESAGHDPRTFSGGVGVFAGMSNNYYFLQNLLAREDVTDIVGWLTTMMGNEKDYLATRVSYKLDLKGPALNIQTACSTSLVAVCTAVQSLLNYQCDLALAGGVSITLPQKRGYLHQEGGITSPDGHCRTFDADSAGTVFSNGVGIVTLRRLSEALEDGDTIYAVIKGAAMNNDGAAKVSFTAPSVEGHAGVITLAQALAGIDPASISYVEAHGTATQLGDPIEIAGLTQAFRAGGASETGTCAIGSVKSNVGHLDAAAGVAGLIKTALALHHKAIPPSLHFTAPNPKLDLEATPFRVVTSLQPWQSPEGSPRRAGVSSFGVGGTNAHVVLEEAPVAAASGAGDGEQLIVLSARSESALDAATSTLRDHLVDHPADPLDDVAFTLQTGRRRFSHRRAVVARGTDDAIERLGSLDSSTTLTGSSTVDEASIAFLFPGQGAQSVGMARALYDGDPGFRADLDECSAVLRSQLGFDLRDVLYPEPGGEELAEQRLAQTAVTQPALFVIEYALALAWRRLGVEPDGMIGHSVGEYVAACLGGVFTRDDALRLVAERARLMQALPAGTMLAVRTTADDVRELLPDDLEIAAENAPSLTVVSGETAVIERFEARLAERDVVSKRLATSHAFHSAMMDPILEAFAEVVASTPRSAPTLPWVSSLTGDWITHEQSQDSAYWVDQVRRPVLFAKGIARLLEEDPARVTLEVGPGRQLTGLAKQTVPGRPSGVVTLRGEEGPSSLLLHAGQLWIAGASLDWSAFHTDGRRSRVPLPTYAFERKRHWVDRAAGEPVASGPDPAVNHDRYEDEMPVTTDPTNPPATGRRDALVDRLRSLFSDLSGMDAASIDTGAAFLELGLDSLVLTQAALLLQKTFDVKISFRELLEELSTIDALADHLDGALPAEAAPVRATPPAVTAMPAGPGAADSSSEAASGGTVERLIAEQLEVMRQQLEMLRGGGAVVPAATMPAPPAEPAVSVAPAATMPDPPAEPAAAEAAPVTGFGPYRPPAKAPAGGLTTQQEQAVEALVERYTQRTGGSKRSTAAHRSHLADPRSVAGFRLAWKELVYPIVTVRSSGSRLWDVDGNEYVDLTNGFGTILFGHNPAFVREALQVQLDQGIETGPQSPLAGEVAARVAAMVGMERVAFCNTGSEAVTAAVRLARTVSGRDRIAVFAGAYHGIFDEVLVRSAGARSMPIAPGIPTSMLDNVVVLDYASSTALDYLKADGDELAALLVEPVQSRRPELQPREFLQDVRRLTAASGTALVFDELVTGFRSHPGGAQAIFGVRADMATYGKVIGGGLPIGLIAGRHEYLDALDGGAWQYGDDSIPEIGVTFFAGTFVRHPLVLAAARAVLGELEERGPDLQRDLNLRTTEFASRLESHVRSVGAPVRISHFSSWLWVDFPTDVPHAGVFHAMMRDRGVHVWEGRCWFLTTAHTDADLELVFAAFRDTLAEMQAGDLLPGGAAAASTETRGSAAPDPLGVIELPLTDGQQDIVLAARISDAVNSSYNLPATLEIKGPIDVAALRRAVARLVARHAALRVTFTEEGTRQRVADKLVLEVPFLDLSRLDGPERAEALEAEQLAEAETTFDLVSGPLIRVRLVRVAIDEHHLFVTVHHAVCDGWSTSIVVRDLTELYRAERRGEEPNTPPAMQLTEYLDSFNDYRDSEAYAVDRTFWHEYVTDAFPQTELPADRPRPALKTYGAERRTRSFGPELIDDLRRLATSEGCTTFAALLGSFECLLARLNDREAVGLAVTIAGHTRFPGRDLVAHCVSVLPLRGSVAFGESFRHHLARTQSALLDAFEHQGSSLGGIVRDVVGRRDASRMPLVSIVFNMDAPVAPFDMDGAVATLGATPRRYENYDVFVNLIPRGDDIEVECTYNTDLFDADTIDRRLEEWATFLVDVVRSGGEKAVGEIDLVAPADLERIRSWNTTQASAALEQTLVSQFTQAVRSSTDAVALQLDDGAVSYGDLLGQANRVARSLAELGVGRGSMVGVMCERSAPLIAATYGVLIAGAAYVPLDIDHPAERLAFMVRETGIRVVLCRGRSEHQPMGDGVTVLYLDELLAGAEPTDETAVPEVDADDLAYVIYTSGSTGRPKGVANTHRGPANLCWWMQDRFRLEPTDVALLKAPFGFDMSVQELFWPLHAGACLVVAAPGGHRDPGYLVETVRHFGVTTATFVPSLLRAFLDQPGAEDCASLQRVICGGEAVTPELRDEFFAVFPSAELHNFYGPTEAAVWVTAGRCRLREPRNSVPIGSPMANNAVHILDSRMQSMPVGVPGELYIGGLQVAVGYVNRDDLTAERFVTDPFDRGGRLYRTGDLARWLPDGQLEHLGRMDRQVKLRGQRIELGEIEVTLGEHPTVLEAAVVVGEDAAGDEVLVAYVVPAGASSDVSTIRDYARTRLPTAMVPAHFVVLDALPLTPNGKIDLQSLPAPDHQAVTAGTRHVAPRTATELRIAAIWANVLGIDDPGVDHDFFDLGGHSLRAAQIVTTLRSEFGVDMAMRHLFEQPTISGLSELVDVLAVATAGTPSGTDESKREEIEI